MFFFMYYLVSILGLFSQLVVAQSVQSRWVVPDGTEPDFSQTFINGNALPVAWEGWNSTDTTSFLHSAVTVANLWVTTFGGDILYTQLLTENVSIANPGSYIWTININATVLSSLAEYALRFSAPGETFDNPYVGSPNIPSPGFIVLPGTTISSTSTSTLSTSPVSTQSSTTIPGSSTSTSTIAASTSSTVLVSVATPTSTSTIAASTSSTVLVSVATPTSTAAAVKVLKAGTIVGIAAGSAIGGAAAIALLVFVFRRRRRGTLLPASKYELQDYSSSQQRFIVGHNAGLDSSEVENISKAKDRESHRSTKWELSGHKSFQGPAELDGD